MPNLRSSSSLVAKKSRYFQQAHKVIQKKMQICFNLQQHKKRKASLCPRTKYKLQRTNSTATLWQCTQKVALENLKLKPQNLWQPNGICPWPTRQGWQNPAVLSLITQTQRMIIPQNRIQLLLSLMEQLCWVLGT